MATDDRTNTQNFPRPHTNNTIAEDFARIITLVNMLDAKISAMDGQVAGKAEAGHTHAIAGIAGLQAALDAKQAASWRPALGELSNVNVAGAASGQFLGLVGATWQPVTLSVAWGNISGKPSSFPTTWGDVSGKPGTFTPAAHSHSIGEVGGLQTALDAKLPLAGGTLAGPLYGTMAGFSGGVTGQAFDSGNAFQINSALGSVIGAICPVNRGGGNYSVAVYGYGGAIGNGWRMILEHDGAVYFPRTQLNADGSLEINVRGSGDRVAYVDFHAHGAPGTQDFSARLIKNSGWGGWIELINLGAGIALKPAANDQVLVGTDNSGNHLRVAPQGGDEGGEIRLGRPATNTSLAADVALDVWRNNVRFLENGGSSRGAYINLTTCAAGAQSEIIHSSVLSSFLASGDTQDIGKYVMAYCNANGSEFGGSVSGANLFPAYHGGYQAASINGTWRAQGRGITGGISLFQRIA